MKDFVYLDVHRADANGAHYPWARVHIDKVQSIVDKYLNSGFHLYTTVQRFANLEHKSPEIEYCNLPFDFDCAEDVEAAHKDTIKLVDYFIDVYDLSINPDEMMVYFSGNRGFHVTVDAECFGAEPMIEMIKVWRILVNHLNKTLNLKTLDVGVYTKRRSWRIPNTIHVKTGLYKIALLRDELVKGVDFIRELAKGPALYLDIKDVI